MIITFATQKGGVGKTTLAIAFANYLSLFKDTKPNVLDFDFQKSFYSKWKHDLKQFHNDDITKSLYPVELVTDENQSKLQNEDILKKLYLSKELFLFDVAGHINTKYNYILQFSKAIVVPFNYSDVALSSTMTFLILLRDTLEVPKENIFLIRNHLLKSANYKNKEQSDLRLSQYGTILDHSVYTKKSMQTINTVSLQKDQKLAVAKVFDELIYNLWGS